MERFGLWRHVQCHGPAMTRCGGTLHQWRALRLQLRTQSAQFGSDTVPHQLENNPRAIPATQT